MVSLNDELATRNPKTSRQTPHEGLAGALYPAAAYISGSDGTSEATGGPERAGSERTTETGETFQAQISRLFRWLRANRIPEVDESELPEVDGRTESELEHENLRRGAEHIARYNESTATWTKWTYGFHQGFGLLPEVSSKETVDRLTQESRKVRTLRLLSALPADYIERLAIVNSTFDVPWTITGYGVKDRLMFIRTEQADAAGEKVTPQEVEDHMTGQLGFKKVKDGVFYSPSDNILVSDIHDENAVRLPNGALAIFDAQVAHPRDQRTLQYIEAKLSDGNNTLSSASRDSNQQSNQTSGFVNSLYLRSNSASPTSRALSGSGNLQANNSPSDRFRADPEIDTPDAGRRRGAGQSKRSKCHATASTGNVLGRRLKHQGKATAVRLRTNANFHSPRQELESRL